jgi:hypothetical protein
MVIIIKLLTWWFYCVTHTVAIAGRKEMALKTDINI